MSKYTEPWAAGLVDLKHKLERQMEKVVEIYIRTTPERLWEAILSGLKTWLQTGELLTTPGSLMYS